MSWRDRNWTYHTAASHASGDSFRRRQRERMRAAAEAAKVVAVKVQPIKKVKA